MFPVHIYNEGDTLPTEGTFFVVAANGYWMHKDNGIVRCFVPVQDLSFLADLKAEQEVKWLAPSIPAEVVWRIKQFFRDVVDKHHAESCTVLYYNKETGKYKVHVPDQQVSHGSVNYRRSGLTHLEEMAGFIPVGTIHSHCDFGAFHSGTDHGDEEYFDGLHATFGHNDKDEFSISVTVVSNGVRQKLDPLTCLEGIKHVNGEFYTLEEPTQGTKELWELEKNSWLDRVNNDSMMPWNRYRVSVSPLPMFDMSRFFGSKDDGDIKTGDSVAWGADMQQVSLKAVMGDGPFEVLEVVKDARNHDKIVVNTKAGKAELSSTLFRKAN